MLYRSEESIRSQSRYRDCGFVLGELLIELRVLVQCLNVNEV